MTLKTKSLHSRGEDLALPPNQVKLLSQTDREGYDAPLFSKKLQEIDLFPLKPTDLEILQINVG